MCRDHRKKRQAAAPADAPVPDTVPGDTVQPATQVVREAGTGIPVT